MSLQKDPAFPLGLRETIIVTFGKSQGNSVKHFFYPGIESGCAMDYVSNGTKHIHPSIFLILSFILKFIIIPRCLMSNSRF